MKKLYFILPIIICAFIALGFGSQTHAQSSLDNMIASIKQQIANLQQQLANLQQQNATPASWCYTFNRNLRIGNVGTAVRNLQTVLSREGLYTGAINSAFNDQLASAVVGFQEKYASEILTPNNLANGTGFVGAATRAKLNSLYGCGFFNGPISVPTQSLIINGVSGPTTLNVGESGTWTINANYSGNPILSYSVTWGDETNPLPMGASNVSSLNYSQTASFTHTYARPGIFMPTFYVRDNSGNTVNTSISVNVGNMTGCVPNWQCGWTQCVNGYQSMTAIDQNNCGISQGISSIACPALARQCSM